MPWVDGDRLWELVERRAEATPDALMVVDEHGRRLTFAAFRDTAERTAAGLVADGVRPGQVVSWTLPTSIDAIVLAAALSRLSVIQNPVLPIYRQRELAFIVDQCGAEVLIVPATTQGTDFPALAAEVADTVGRDLRVMVHDHAWPQGDPATLPAVARAGGHDADPVRWVFYTSGTTADPKGARHTDRSILAVARGLARRLELTESDRNGVLFPFTHIGGPLNLAEGLMTGAATIVMARFEPVAAVELLAREGVTLAGSGTAFHLGYLAVQAERNEPIFPALRACPGGGAPKPAHLHARVKAELGGVGIVSGWGLTEAPALTMASPRDPDDKLAVTEGRPLPGVQLRVVADDGRSADPGEQGELVGKAPQLMAGYVDASLDATVFDDEGWFHTGDLGFIDEDGYVVVTGRLKDVIIRNGENISAKEVEDLLFEHPAIADVAVIGLPDERTGERACAVIQAQPGAAPPDVAELQRFLTAAELRRQAIPEQIEVVEAMPRGSAGKVDKRALQDRFAPTTVGD